MLFSDLTFVPVPNSQQQNRLTVNNMEGMCVSLCGIIHRDDVVMATAGELCELGLLTLHASVSTSLYSELCSQNNIAFESIISMHLLKIVQNSKIAKPFMCTEHR